MDNIGYSTGNLAGMTNVTTRENAYHKVNVVPKELFDFYDSPKFSGLLDATVCIQPETGYCNFQICDW